MEERKKDRERDRNKGLSVRDEEMQLHTARVGFETDSSMNRLLRAGRLRFDSRQEQEIFSSPLHPFRLRSPPKFLSNRYWG
jgi:hypothetical protein